METNIIINDNQAPFIPKGLLLFEHKNCWIREFNPELMELTVLDEIEGPFIWREGYINLNASLLDHFLAYPESIPQNEQFEKAKEFGGPIYFMETTYNPVLLEKDGTFSTVRSMIYDRENNVWREGPTHLYNQEFYGGYAILHKINSEIVKQGEEYWKKVLNEHIGKKIKIWDFQKGYWRTPNKIIPILGLLENIKDDFGLKVEILKENQKKETFSFFASIFKITDESGEVLLYDNSALRWLNSQPHSY